MSKTITLGKVGVTFEGDYDSSKNYASRTCVFYNHVSWASKKDVPAGIAPGTNNEYWQKVSERGAQGIQGERGPQGNSAFDGTGVEIVNDLTSGGEAAVLSAEQGKILKTELTELESFVGKSYIVDKNGGGDFTSLLEGILKATGEFDSHVYVQRGEYDLIQEFTEHYGDDFFNAYTASSAKGIILKNRVVVEFAPNTKVTCHYTGDNIDVQYRFSAFNSDRHGFSLIGLNLETSKIRYSIHDERTTYSDAYINRYKGCTITQDNTNNTYNFRAVIGGGFGKNGLVFIEDCTFESKGLTSARDIVSYHNTTSDEGKSEVHVSGCRFKGYGSFAIKGAGTSTEISMAYVHDNWFELSAPLTPTIESGYDVLNVQMKEWNNVIINEIKPSIINVTEQYPLTEGYYTFETAVLAIPRVLRKNGLIVQYAPNSYTWRYAQFYKVGVANFSDDVWSRSVNWINIGAPYSPFFSNEHVCSLPHLNAIKSVTIEALSAHAIVPKILSLTYLKSNASDDSNMIIINFDHAIASASKAQSLVLKATPDGNILTFVKEQNMVRYTIVVDKSFWVYGINVQTNYDLWLDLVNYKFIPYSAKLEKSVFFTQTNFTRKFGDNFLIDMSIRGGEPEKYVYFPYIIDINNNDANVISIARVPIEDTTQIESIAYINIDSFVDKSGIVKFNGRANMTAHSDIGIAFIIDWNIAKLYANNSRVVFYSTTASFSDIVFSGGLGLAESGKYERLRQLDVMPNGSYTLGKLAVTKMKDVTPLISTQYYDNGDGVVQSVKNMSAYSIGDGKKYAEIFGKKYINLTSQFRFLEITPDEKIWFANRNTHNLHYFNNVDELLADTPTIVQIGNVLVNAQDPCAIKMNSKGELIVVAWCESQGLGVSDNVIRVYKSDSNFENWKQVLTYNTEYAGLSYPDWSVKAEGDRLLLAGYGSHTSTYDNAIWDIYYSYDGGDTWYSHLFRLGEMVDIDGWSPTDRIEQMHIHGVAIDHYRNRLMVMNGDTEVSLFVTTNLSEWELNTSKEDSWSPDNENALHWKRLSVMDSMKFTSGLALPNCLLFGTDALPNGFQRINIIEEYNNKNECALSEPQWATQRINADGTGDFGFYGFTLDQHSPSTPVICSLQYVGGVQPSDYKRNCVYATDDGYTFSKIWEDDRDVVSYDGEEFTPLRPRTILTSRVNKNGDVLIQTCDSRFNDLVNGYPAPTSHHTLVIGKLNM